MAADPNSVLTDGLQRMVYQQAIPAVLIATLLALVVLFLRGAFERWLARKIRARKEARNAKQYAGLTEDEVLDAPHCPKCGAMMVVRTATKGENAGSRFWGCSAFPKCRGTRDYA